MKNKNKILDKVQKLLRLSTSDNINEAATAAKLAQELMHKHNLSTLMVETADAVEEEKIEEMDQPLQVFNKKASTWKSRLAMVVARANNCRTLIRRSNTDCRLLLVGYPSDTQNVKFLFDYLLKEIERLTLRDAVGKGKTWANSYKLGAVETVEDMLKTAMESAFKDVETKYEEDGIALVHLNKAIQKLDDKKFSVDQWIKDNLSLRQGRRLIINYHTSARLAGRLAAKELDINPAQKKLVG